MSDLDDMMKRLEVDAILEDERTIDAQLLLLEEYLNNLIQMQLSSYENYGKTPLTPAVDIVKAFGNTEMRRVHNLLLDIKLPVQKAIMTLRIMKLVLKWAPQVKDTEVIKVTIVKLQELTKYNYAIGMLNALLCLFEENLTADEFIAAISDRIGIEGDRNEISYRKLNKSTNGDFRTKVARNYIASIGDDDIVATEKETAQEYFYRIVLEYLNFILDLESAISKAKR